MCQQKPNRKKYQVLHPLLKKSAYQYNDIYIVSKSAFQSITSLYSYFHDNTFLLLFSNAWPVFEWGKKYQYCVYLHRSYLSDGKDKIQKTKKVPDPS